jgi:4-alpha-glucanotransferase
MTPTDDKNSYKTVKMDKRGSGILLHITSLPSSYGVGDLGPEAYRFVDFLKKTKQRYWQVLPLNPTDPLYGNSPYSSVSAFAGNTLLISPDLLLEEALLSTKDLEHIPPFPEDHCAFSKVIRYKGKLLERAYQHFNQRWKGREPFEAFCSENSSWLEDFSVFVVLKKHFDGKVWNQWPKKLRDRNLKALKEIKKNVIPKSKRKNSGNIFFIRSGTRLNVIVKKRG